MALKIEYEFAIYYLPKPAADPLAHLRARLDAEGAFFKLIPSEGNPDEAKPCVRAIVVENPHETYTPPDPEMLKRFGKSLSPEEAEQVQKTESAVRLRFFYSKDHVWDGLKASMQLAEELAMSTGGLLWDGETRELFSLNGWRDRLATWTEDVPEIPKMTVIHAYKSGEYIRAITLGMSKFGLPDLVIQEFSWSMSQNMGIVLNLLAQSLAEGAALPRLGEFDLDIRAVKNAQVRDPQINSLELNATGLAQLNLVEGTWEDGDPDNRLMEIRFDRGVGPDVHSRQMQVLDQAFGSEDSVTRINHDERLSLASAQARSHLPALRAAFAKGLAPGELVQLKAPFETPDGGNEWMWVEVTTWNGDEVTGLLMNEPFSIPTLKAGQSVTISESDVFDYLRQRPDGTTEGNETGKIIQQMQNE